MDEEKLKQIVAELTDAQGHALRVLSSAFADMCGDRAKLASMVEIQQARLQHAEPHPISEEWTQSVIRDLRGERD